MSVCKRLSAGGQQKLEARTAYADCEPTVAMMVRRTWSLMVNGPGFICTPKMETLGRTRTQRRPMGKESSRAKRLERVTKG